MHLAAVLPIGLLGWIYAGPFLTLWVGQGLGSDPEAIAPLMRLFLTASIPLVLSVPVQMAIGVNRIEVIALSALAGSLINLPISYFLTLKLGVAGVIWGTVLTTFASNLIVPGAYVFRVLSIDPRTFFKRSLSAPLAGAAAIVAATWLARQAMPITYPGASLRTRAVPLLIHLTIGTIAYVAGFLLVPTGRADLAALRAKLRRR
jgi:hypothetical protein